MTTTTAPLRIDVDLANPGQFLACCGLLELAGRLDPEAVGWFRGDVFYLAFAGPDLLTTIAACSVDALADYDEADTDDEAKSPPVLLGDPYSLRLDWWNDENATRAGFKTWSGGQTVLGFVRGMRSHIRRNMGDRQLLKAMPVRTPKPFYFDGRLSRLTSLDMGFSAQRFAAAFSPAVELLALIGLQRFRPFTIIERERYGFVTWREPLPPAVAAAVASGMIATLSDCRYAFPLVIRTGGKYKAFGPATLERRNSDG
ncbi:MAG TPA: hypothetical protein PLP01_01720 [Phycisphaerae bacterium]|nr:hypothetical protein [Phycisphaerae bacterium]